VNALISSYLFVQLFFVNGRKSIHNPVTALSTTYIAAVMISYISKIPTQVQDRCKGHKKGK
jgi:hypothetical protein